LSEHSIALAHQFDDLEQQKEASIFGMWVFLVTEVMFFGGMFTGYAAYRFKYHEAFMAGSNHLDILLGGINTAVLILSSLTMAMAVHAAQLSKRRALMTYLVLTMLLGSVFLGIKACVERRGGKDLKGVRIAIQGCGNVARYLCEHLAKAGAKLFVTDIVAEKAQMMVDKHGAKLVKPEEIYDLDCDVFAPCALGAVINDDTIPRLKCRIVAGGANNVLLSEQHGDRLRERGIIYAPDFVINAGGIINVSVELEPKGYNEQRALEKVTNIYNAVRDILETAEREKIASNRAAILFAERKIAEGRNRKAAGPR